ncbi:MAG: metallophosphoesterase family protein [Ruminococcus sp.]|jgi:predicted phosphodiesterase
MIFITGDTHGDWISRLRTEAFSEQKEMTKDDCVIICGDFGIWDNSKREKNNLDWLESKSFTTLFIDGNHENYDILDGLPVSEWNGGKVHFLRPSVIHLMRGQVFAIEDKIFFTFGGARSHDIQDGILEAGDPRIKEWKRDYVKMFRINHVSWWEREMPSDAEMDEGIENLQRIGCTVDFVVSHCGPASAVAQYSHGGFKTDCLTQYFEEIRSKLDYKKWFMGHYHDNKAINDKEIILYEQIIRIA